MNNTISYNAWLSDYHQIYREQYDFIVSLLDNLELDIDSIKEEVKNKVLEPRPGKYRIIDIEYMKYFL